MKLLRGVSHSSSV